MYTCVNTFVCVFVKGKGTYVCVQQLAMLITHGDISNCICLCVCVCACACVCLCAYSIHIVFSLPKTLVGKMMTYFTNVTRAE